jgi:hypothetical protein
VPYPAAGAAPSAAELARRKNRGNNQRPATVSGAFLGLRYRPT